jgi:hypothetical protein
VGQAADGSTAVTKPPPFDPKKTTGHYILIGKLAVPEPDLYQWASWFEAADRHVFSTYVGKVWISTIFLGLDHSFNFENNPDVLPILFETMAFDGRTETTLGPTLYCDRCGTWEEAEAQHKEAVAFVRGRIKETVND